MRTHTNSINLALLLQQLDTAARTAATKAGVANLFGGIFVAKAVRPILRVTAANFAVEARLTAFATTWLARHGFTATRLAGKQRGTYLLLTAAPATAPLPLATPVVVPAAKPLLSREAADRIATQSLGTAPRTNPRLAKARKATNANVAWERSAHIPNLGARVEAHKAKAAAHARRMREEGDTEADGYDESTNPSNGWRQPGLPPTHPLKHNRNPTTH